MTISIACAWWDYIYENATLHTYEVPDNRKGVLTPSTNTMFFTPGFARVFLLLATMNIEGGTE